jgi:hypothetical protein
MKQLLDEKNNIKHTKDQLLQCKRYHQLEISNQHSQSAMGKHQP